MDFYKNIWDSIDNTSKLKNVNDIPETSSFLVAGRGSH
jgi:hypothetical protein